MHYLCSQGSGHGCAWVCAPPRKRKPINSSACKRELRARFCRSTRRFPLQPSVSHGCNRLRSLPTPTWQTEPRMCLGEGVIFNSCASIIKADSVCKINLGEHSDYRLSAPLSASSWIKARGKRWRELGKPSFIC